jgi:hypothetical protein
LTRAFDTGKLAFIVRGEIKENIMNAEGLILFLQMIFVSIAVVVGLLLATRYLLLWYFRINEIVDLLKKQTELLETITNERTHNVPKPIITPAPAQPSRNPLTQK